MSIKNHYNSQSLAHYLRDALQLKSESLLIGIIILLIAYLLGLAIGSSFYTWAKELSPTSYKWIAGILSLVLILSLFWLFLLGVIVLSLTSALVLWLVQYIPKSAVIITDQDHFEIYVWILLGVTLVTRYYFTVRGRLLYSSSGWQKLRAFFPWWLAIPLFIYLSFILPAQWIAG